jgi:hypothetical protein
VHLLGAEILSLHRPIRNDLSVRHASVRHHPRCHLTVDKTRIAEEGGHVLGGRHDSQGNAVRDLNE